MLLLYLLFPFEELHLHCNTAKKRGFFQIFFDLTGKSPNT